MSEQQDPSGQIVNEYVEAQAAVDEAAKSGSLQDFESARKEASVKTEAYVADLEERGFQAPHGLK